jgi:hypothetical protein
VCKAESISPDAECYQQNYIDMKPEESFRADDVIAEEGDNDASGDKSGKSGLSSPSNHHVTISPLPCAKIYIQTNIGQGNN